MNIASLDVPIGEEKDSTLKDFIENRDALTAFDIVAEKILGRVGKLLK